MPALRLLTRLARPPCTPISHTLSWVRERSSVSLTHSYLSNPGDWPLLGLTMGQLMDRAHDLYGDREALVSCAQGLRKTFTQVNQESRQLAAGLVALGLQPGDRLGIWGANSYEWYLTQWAAAKAGLILVNVNPAYRPSELEYCLNKVGVKAIICDQQFKSSNYYEMLCSLAPELPTAHPAHLASARLPHLQHVIICSQDQLSGTLRLSDVQQAGEAPHLASVDRLASELQFDQPCNIQFTSGTTGNPKAAILSHHMLVNNGYGVGYRNDSSIKEHRLCLSVPLYHCFGCVGGNILGAAHGSTCVLPSAGFDPEACIQAVQDEKLTSCYGTPTMFVDMLKVQRNKPRDVSSLSTGIMAGAPCPPELVSAVMNELNMKDFLVMYGMTETSPVTFECFPSDPAEVRINTIGFPSDHIEVKVVDGEDRIIPVNQPGELCIRGYCNFLGYWGDPEKTTEMMGSDRWLRTGDLAVLREDGYCQIVGRIKDVLIRGGENIYPTELENFLMTHPGVLEVQVFGVPDYRMGEEVAAWVKTSQDDLDEESLKAWCKGKIAHYKIPRYILFKDQFPTTITGKNQKFVMRDTTIKELNL